MPLLFDPVASLDALAGFWRWTSRVQQASTAAASRPEMIERLQHSRLAELLVHARAKSPFYRRRHAGLGIGLPLARFPVLTRAELMADFDHWVTDPQVRLADVERFVADPRLLAEPYLGRYAVWTSSGSTGRPGIYLQDRDALAIYDALLVTRFPRSREAASPFAVISAGGRFAMIAALGGHFAGVVSWERMRRESPWMAASMRTFSVLAPLHELVAQLNEFAPAVVASYPTTMLLLARERAAGRLRIRPCALWSGGETLARVEREEIASAFGAPVIDGYGASECLQIAFDCGCGSLHLNSDWVILEAVDEHGRAVPAGEPSATCLLTNLANRVQPLIRYDLGDSLTYRAQRCRCGSPFPALEVDGRRDDILVLVSASGARVSLPPLAVATVIEESSGVHRFQVIQSGPRALRVRFETPPEVGRDQAWERILGSLRTYLDRHGLEGVTVRESATLPQSDPVSGKLREVLGMRPAQPRSRRKKETPDDARYH